MADDRFKFIVRDKLELSFSMDGYGVSVSTIGENGEFIGHVQEDELEILFTLLQKRKELRDK